MEETVTQYTERLLGYVGEDSPLRILETTIPKIEELIARSTPQELKQKPSAEGWSAAQILGHLWNSELVFGYRIRMIASVSGTNIQAYDQNLWISKETYAMEHVHETVKAIKSLREYNLNFLKSLPEQVWDQFGIHQERGKESIRDIVRLYAGHDRNHFMQLEAMLLRK